MLACIAIGLAWSFHHAPASVFLPVGCKSPVRADSAPSQIRQNPVTKVTFTLNW